MTSDEQLLLGLLALQNDFVSREDLVGGVSLWLTDKARHLGEILLEQKSLDEDEYQLLQALVRKHLERHDNDPEKSLASLSSVGSLRHDLGQLGDADVDATLSRISATHDDDFQSSATLPPGAPFTGASRFRVLRPHARGGLGEVFVAEDLELNREVALKEIQSRHAENEDSRTRFMLEAEVTGGLEHPGIVPVYGLGQYGDGRPYYAMRFIRGDSLKDAIKRFHDTSVQDGGDRTLQLRQLLRRFVDVCNAIHYAHSRGILHRDLKPGNVMLGKYGETLVVDWGLAKVAGRTETSTVDGETTLKAGSGSGSAETQFGIAIGTPAYMPPEQAAGRLDDLGPASDVYSLGATLYHLLTGQPPQTDADVGVVLSRVQVGEFTPPRSIRADIPRALEQICLKAMATSPRDRYDTPQDLSNDLERWLADEPVSAHRESYVERVTRWTRKHRSWTLAGAATVLAVAVVSVLASYLIVRSQQQAARAWELAAKTREFDLRLTQDDVLQRETLDQLQQLIAEIEEFSDEDAELRRSKLRDEYSLRMHNLLGAARFTDDGRDYFDSRMDLLASSNLGDKDRLESLLNELRQLRDDRLSSWDLLFQVSAEAPVPVFAPDVVEISPRKTLRRPAGRGEGFEIVPTQVACPSGDIELQAAFDSTWLDSSVVGITLNATNNHQYEFLVTVPQFDHRDRTSDELSELATFGEVIRVFPGKSMHMHILRDGQPLGRGPVTIREGELRLLARRQGSQLRFTVNDNQTIEFLDPFPLPADEPGVFGVFWPRTVELDKLQAQRLRAPRLPSPTQRGDELFRAERFAEALDSFRKIDSPEARFKAALCSYEQGDFDTFTTAIDDLAREAPAAEFSNDDRWRLRAACHLLQFRVEEEEWDEVRELLNYVSESYQRDDIAALIPADQRDLILQPFRRSGANRSYYFAAPETAIEDLQWTIRAEELFDEDASQRRITRWRLADAYRWSDQRGDALEIVQQLIDEVAVDSKAPIEEQLALIFDQAWILSLENDLDGMLQRLNSWLLDESGTIRSDYAPLLMIRGIYYYKVGQVDAASADLDQFFATVPMEAADHSFFAHACALRGLIYEELGHQEQALEMWKRGLRRNWHAGYLEPKHVAQMNGHESVLAFNSIMLDQLLASWTGEFTAEEGTRLMHNLYPGSGLFSSSFKKLWDIMFEPEFVRQFIIATFRSARGRAVGKEMILGNHGAGESPVALLACYEAIRLSCLGDITVTPDLEELFLDVCDRALAISFKGEYSETNIRQIMNLWRGRFSKSDFGQLATKTEQHDPTLFPSVAMLFGNKYALDGNPAVAKFLFDYVLSQDNANPAVVALARQQLAKLDFNDAE